MLRFVDGVPKAMFFSEHATGVAVDYDAVEKIGNRVCDIPFFPIMLFYLII